MDKCREIFNELVEKVYTKKVFSCPNDEYKIHRHLSNREPIPDYLLPGRTILELDEHQRKELNKLTSDMTSKYRALPY